MLSSCTRECGVDAGSGSKGCLHLVLCSLIDAGVLEEGLHDGQMTTHNSQVKGRAVILQCVSWNGWRQQCE